MFCFTKTLILLPKFEKPFSQRDFFNRILFKVGEHEHIYISEIKFEENILLKNGG